MKDPLTGRDLSPSCWNCYHEPDNDLRACIQSSCHCMCHDWRRGNWNLNYYEDHTEDYAAYEEQSLAS